MVSMPGANDSAARRWAASELAEGIVADTGKRLRLKISRSRSTALVLPAAVFAHGSSFPGPGVRAYLSAIVTVLDETPELRIAVFGHADPSGSDLFNKILSERRAKAVLALLTDDHPLFEKVADDDGGWGVLQYQSMLRGLGANPGAIDGLDGPNTRRAVRSFQLKYNADFFHAGRPRARATLVVDGLLGPNTETALRDAYVLDAPASLPKSRLIGSGAFGCSEFNLHSRDAAENRRVVIGLFNGRGPAEADFPCQEGDPKACPLKSRDPRLRCSFYARQIEEQETEGPRLFDFQWLRESSEKTHLSALTTLPDQPSAIFTIVRTRGALPNPPPASNAPGDPIPQLGDEITRIEGRIAGGVCFARWEHDERDDPFDFRSWFAVSIESDDPDDDDDDDDDNEWLRPLDRQDDWQAQETRALARQQLHADVTATIPTFSVEAEGHWGFAPPPGNRLDQVQFSDDSASGVVVALRNDGRLISFTGTPGRINAKGEFRILSLGMAGHSINLKKVGP